MYLVRDDIAELDEQQTNKLILALPDWRREAALKYKHLAGRRESATAYLLLLEALKQQYGVNQPPHYVIGTHGKPSLLEYPHIHFNTSHCHTAVICAVCDTPIGVDIERRRCIKDSLINHTMNEEEKERIKKSNDREMEFLRLWTAKEAVVKLSGEGIRDNMRDILTLAMSDGITIRTHVNTHKDYVYSLAQYTI